MGATGTAILDFGAFPGGNDTSVAVTGQTGIVAGSLVEAWIRPVDTADHTADEHMVEGLRVFAATIVAGTGFTIYGFHEPMIIDRGPGELAKHQRASIGGVNTTNLGRDILGGEGQPPETTNQGSRIYGQFTVAWAWN